MDPSAYEDLIEDCIKMHIDKNSGVACYNLISNTYLSAEAEEINLDNVPLLYKGIDITPEKSAGILKTLLKEGEGGKYPEYGDRVFVQHKSYIIRKRKARHFDSTPKDKFYKFNLGRGEVLKVMDIGVSSMKKGEVAIFICQPEYARIGNPPLIPPSSSLLLKVKLCGWALEDLSPEKDNSILRKVIEKGEDGASYPNEGASVKVKLGGFLNGKTFEEREVSFILGEGCNENIPDGLELALFRFPLNEKSFIFLKDKYLLDVEGADDIPPEKYVKYEVSLISFEKVKEIWEMNPVEILEKAQLSKQKGNDYFKAGNYKVALKQYRWILTYLEDDPDVPEGSEDTCKSLLLSGFLNIALCLLKLENFIEAIKFCNKALEIDAINEKALFLRGQARMRMNDCKEALQDFQTLCINYPENKDAQNRILSCKIKIQKQLLKEKSTYKKIFE